MLRPGLVVLTLALAACGATQPGIVVPAGSHHVAVTFRGLAASGCDAPPSIIASTSLDQLHDAVAARCRGAWNTQMTGEQGELYVAVLTTNECRRSVAEDQALDGRTLYFIHWISKPNGVCNAMMALPSFRLYTVPISELPGSGKLTVELLIQDEVDGTSHIDTEVDLA